MTEPDDIARVATILAAGDRIRYLTPRLHAEMISELRWPGDPCPDTGIDVLSLELDPGDLAVLDILKRPDVMAHLARWNAGTALGEDTRRRVLASSAVAVISVARGNLDRLCARRICCRGGMDYRTAAAGWLFSPSRRSSSTPATPTISPNCRHPSPTSWATCSKNSGSSSAYRPDASPALVLRFAVSGPASVRSRRNLDRFVCCSANTGYRI